MASGQHSAAPSALGYQYQTSWCLFELLRHAPDRPDASISLELHDDVAWDMDGTATELLQLKHHMNEAGSLGDQSADLWKTVEVWLNAGDAADLQGPALTLVTTSTASPGSAAFALRADNRDTATALDLLRTAAVTSTAKSTAKTGISRISPTRLDFAVSVKSWPVMPMRPKSSCRLGE